MEVALPPVITGAAMIGITTLHKNPDNFLTNIINGENDSTDAEKFIKIVEITTACKECIHNQTLDECTHKAGESPAWHQQNELAQIQKMMGGDSGTFARESLGIQTDTNTSKYYPEHDISFAHKNKMTRKFGFNRLFTTLDPAAGGERSKTSVVTFAWSNDRMIVRKGFFYIIQFQKILSKNSAIVILR